MATVRLLSISNFRGISFLEWRPSPGINALVGPGDSGKSTVVEALDLVLGGRRQPALSDADFHRLDVTEEVRIRVTLGNLPEALPDIEAGIPVLGFDPGDGSIHPEATGSLEHVVTLQFTIGADLEARWSFAGGTSASGDEREARWAHRDKLQALRLGASPLPHLSWGQRSVLNRISESRPATGEALAAASRQARQAFAGEVTDQFEGVTRAVSEVAAELGVRGALHVDAALSAHSVSVRDGAIALHDAMGVPLANLGVGSARLLAAGLQARAAGDRALTLIDEFEHGLEPYRIARLLHHLGAKREPSPQQVVLTTHSPVVLRELAAHQVWVVRRDRNGRVALHQVSKVEGGQATLRSSAEAFLCPSILVCEGPTEQGLLRGLDLCRTEAGEPSMALMGTATSDGAGDSMFARALAFAHLGYRVALLRDCDKPAPPSEGTFEAAGGRVFRWEPGKCTEQQLIEDLPEAARRKLLELAIALNSEDAVRQQLENAGAAGVDLAAACRAFPPGLVAAFGKAANKGKWFKNQDRAEQVGRLVVGPVLDSCGWTLEEVISNVFRWMAAGPGGPHADG